MLYLMLFMNLLFAQEPVDEKIIVEEPRSNFQKIQVYIDISEVHAPDGSKGTSMPLNILLSHNLQAPHRLQRRLQYWSNPQKWYGSIEIYDWSNVMYMPTFNQCDYSDAIRCGIQNGHWTLRTVILVGQKYSTITMKLYDNKGKIMGKSSNTTWGFIRWKPQWKLTKIKDQGPMGEATREIFEMWPPKIEEIPPLITPHNINQASYGVYDVVREGCRTRYCLSK